MILPQQIQAVILHFLMGVLFALVYSYLSLCLSYCKVLMRSLITSVVCISYTILFYYLLYQVNYGVTQLYCIVIFAVGFLLFYFYLYPLFFKFYLISIQLLKPFIQPFRVAKVKMCGIIPLGSKRRRTRNGCEEKQH